MEDITKMANEDLILHAQYIKQQIDRSNIIETQKSTLNPDPYPMLPLEKIIEDSCAHISEWYECARELGRRGINIDEKI